MVELMERPFYIDLMPRVTSEYLERRRQQILDAAQRCFARKGFYETSMRDVFCESGLSAGAVYRYFKSKDQLIQTISARVFKQVAGLIEASVEEDFTPTPSHLVGKLAQELSGPDGPGCVALPAWAAALHDPDVATTVRGVLAPLRTWWVRAAGRMRDDGHFPPGTDVDAVGTAMFALLPGFLVQHLILRDPDAATFQRGVRELLSASVEAAT